MFKAIIKGVVSIDESNGDKERGVIATREFETLAEAEKYAVAEMHGIEGANYEVEAMLPVQKAINLVLASRNRDIAIYCQHRGHRPDLGENTVNELTAYLHLKAPGTVAALRAFYKYADDKCLVPVQVGARHLYVG